MRFKSTGLRILESFEGDMLITDSKLKHDLILTSELLDKAENDVVKSHLLVKSLIRFIKVYKEERWRIVKEDLLRIAKTDRPFLKYRKKHIKNGGLASLKKLEKDIWFWKQGHGTDDIVNKLNKIRS